MTFLQQVTWKNSLALPLLVAGLSFVLSPLAWADGPVQPEVSSDQSRSLIKDVLGLSGSFRSDFFSKDASFSGNTGYVVDSLWLTAEPKEVAGIKTYFDARVQGQDLTRSSTLKWDLREGYAEKSFGDLNIKVGRQITVWGRADKVNPTDVWSTRDYTLLTTDDEDQRLGVTAVQAAWDLGYFHMIGIWQPEWRTPSYPIAPPPPGVSLQYLTPSDSAAQAGFKLDHSGTDLDFSLSYAHVINRTPDFTVLSAGAQGVQTGLQFNSINVIGTDAAFVVGDYGIRAEAAYTATENGNGANPIEQNNNIFTVIGVDRTFNGELNFNIQYLYKHVFNWHDPSQISDPNTSLLASEEHLLSNQLGSDMHGASARIDYKAFNETLEYELAGVTWFSPGEYALRPKVSYAFSDHLKGVVGGQVFWGNSGTLYGSLHPISTVFAELRLGF